MRKFAAVSISLLTIAVLPAQSAQTVNELAQRFKIAKSERERVEVCLDAIDNHYIELGCSITRVDEIFGTDFARHLPPAGKFEYQELHFTPRPEEKSPPGEPVHDTTWEGWFLDVKFGSTGVVMNYYLSNCFKQL